MHFRQYNQFIIGLVCSVTASFAFCNDELNPPIVNAIYVDNSILDVTTGNQTLTLTVNATDDSDIDWPSSYIALDDPNSSSNRYIYGSNENPGTFTTSFSTSDEGVWKPKYLRIYDVFNNYFFESTDSDFSALGLTGLIVNNGFYDDINQVELNPPIVNAIYVDNSILDVTTGNQTLTLTVNATDDSDIDWPSSYIALDDPNSSSNRYIYGSNENPGTFTTSFSTSDEGVWKPKYLRIYDVFNNYFFESTDSDFSALGLTGLIVNNGFYDNPISNSSWDFDESSSVDALTDGLLLIRYAFGLRGEKLTNAAIGLESTLTTEEIQGNIEQALVIADIDSDGTFGALTDGLILLRYFFGLRGDSLISGVISPNANRTSAADIEAYIESHMP